MPTPGEPATPDESAIPVDPTSPDDPAAETGDGRLEAWEVFRRERPGDPMVHGGSVLAPDAELAGHYAREMYGRRQESERLWIVRRAEIHDLHDPDLLQPPLDRSYKKPGGYAMREKLAAARERTGGSRPKARPG